MWASQGEAPRADSQACPLFSFRNPLIASGSGSIDRGSVTVYQVCTWCAYSVPKPTCEHVGVDDYDSKRPATQAASVNFFFTCMILLRIQIFHTLARVRRASRGMCAHMLYTYVLVQVASAGARRNMDVWRVGHAKSREEAHRQGRRGVCTDQ